MVAAKPSVQKPEASPSIVTFKVTMMVVMKSIRLPVVLVPAVASEGREEKVHSVPQTVEWGGIEKKGRERAGVVVKVFDGMHAEPRKWLNVSVSVMQRVDLQEHRPKVQKPMREVKVEIAP